MGEESATNVSTPRRTRILLWAGLAVIAVLVGVGLWLASRPPRPPLQGEVEAETVNVATKTLARVDRFFAEEGDKVKRGQLLATLTAPEVESGRQEADAALQTARALQQIAQQGARVQDVETPRANWQAAQATANLAATTSRRSDRLYAQGVISTQRRDEATAARESTARIAQAARLQYEKAASGTRKQDREIANAQVSAATALVSSADALQRETSLISPIDGEIARRSLEPGEIVVPVVPVFQVTDIARPKVSIDVREDDYHDLRQNMVLRGSVPALGRAYDFRVTQISPQGSFATIKATRQSRGYDVRVFAVTLKPVTAIKGLRPGMSVLFDWPQ